MSRVLTAGSFVLRLPFWFCPLALGFDRGLGNSHEFRQARFEPSHCRIGVFYLEFFGLDSFCHHSVKSRFPRCDFLRKLLPLLLHCRLAGEFVVHESLADDLRQSKLKPSCVVKSSRCSGRSVRQDSGGGGTALPICRYRGYPVSAGSRSSQGYWCGLVHPHRLRRDLPLDAHNVQPVHRRSKDHHSKVRPLLGRSYQLRLEEYFSCGLAPPRFALRHRVSRFP